MAESPTPLDEHWPSAIALTPTTIRIARLMQTLAWKSRRRVLSIVAFPTIALENLNL